MRENNVYLFRGFYGRVFSTGMDSLAAKIKEQLDSVDNVNVYAYEEWWTVFDKLKTSSENAVLIGHSFGALAAYKIVNVLNKKNFPLVISFDYSPYYSGIVSQMPNGIAPDNVKYVLNFYQKNDPIIRGVVMTRPDGSDKDIHNIKSDKMHIEIDKAPELHDEAIETIRYYM